MSRTTSVHFSPPVGCRINLVDATNGSTVVASTLSVRDRTPFKHRTPKGTPKGQEYFYVKIHNGNGWDFVKMLNSLTLPNCISEDKRYIFEGELPNGGTLIGGIEKKVVRVVEPMTTHNQGSKQIQSFSNETILNTL
jgi:hypothetical protein